MARYEIERRDGTTVTATHVRHLRTLTHAGRSDDIDLVRLPDGTEVEVMSPADDGRVTPREVVAATGHYPGYPAGA